MNLSAKAVAGLELPPGKLDTIYFDASLPGFGFRLRRRSAAAPVRRSWVIQYRHGGATRRLKLASAGVLGADAARAQAKKLLAAAALGQDPGAARGRREHTFAVVAQEYLEHKRSRVRRKTLKEVTRYLTGDYFRPLHRMSLAHIQRRDIAACVMAIERRSGPTVARQACNSAQAFFIWAMRAGLAESNPSLGVVKPKEAEPGTRVLNDSELAAVWTACAECGEFGRITRLLILTGSRRTEIGAMQWAELDADAATWTLPGERSKNRRPHTLPLPPAAWEILDAVPRLVGREFLFGSHGIQGFGGYGSAKAGLDQRLGDKVGRWRIHDIRRTVATRMADIGVQPHVIEQILNHQSGHRRGPAGVYNRSAYAREVRAALALWAEHVRALVQGGERKVLPFVPASAT